MDENNKLPLKRVELSLTKFNEVAIPHHLDLLRQHKANIVKYEIVGEWARVRSEQTHARRVTSQLRALLAEMDALRRQVDPKDLITFDTLTQRSRELTLRAIVDYLGMIEGSCRVLVDAAQTQLNETSPLSINRVPVSDKLEVGGSVTSSESVGLVQQHDELLQLQVDDQEVALREREAVLRGWCELQTDVRELHQTWGALQHAAATQRHTVAHIHTNIEETDVNVSSARASLAGAERLSTAMWGAGGAAVGALTGGPLGMLVGLKAGAAAAILGGAMGYWGARLLGVRRGLQIQQGDTPHSDDTKDKAD